MITIRYALSEAGQRASLLAGEKGSKIQTAIVKPGEPGWAEAVVLVPLSQSGPMEIPCHFDIQHVNGKYPDKPIPAIEYDSVPTVAKLLEDQAGRIAKATTSIREIKEKEKAEHEAEVQRVLSCPISDLIDVGTYSIDAKSGPWNDPRTKDRKAEIDTEVIRLRDERKSKQEAAEIESKAKKEKALKDFADWVRMFGSEHAKALLENGFETWKRVGREDFATEKAVMLANHLHARGFKVGEADSGGTAEPLKTPTVDEIKCFAAACDYVKGKGHFGEIELMLVDRADYEDEAGYGEVEPEFQTEMRVDVTVPGLGWESSRYFVIG